MTFVLTAFVLMKLFSGGLGFCPEQCSCNDEVMVVECSQSNLEVLPITLNPGIQRLQLQFNNIKTVDAALGFYGQLEFVDLSHNELVSVPDRGFTAQKKLVELRLADNKVSKISNTTFHGLKSLAILSLRRNFLEELTANVFVNVANVEELDVGQNRIRRIHPDAFNGMEQLRVLYIDDNDLKSVPSQAFTPIPHLAELHLGGNSIEQIQDKAFHRIVNLYELDLHGASIYNISEKGFSGLETLRVLKLSANALDKIPSSQISVLDRLEQLFLGENFIEAIPDNVFQSLRKLRVLDLSKSKNLMIIEGLAFSENSNLAWLRLSGCRSVSIETGALKLVTGLRTVHLADMGWDRVPPDLLAWHNIKVCDLKQNPLICDCKSKWLRDTLSGLSNNSSGAECYSPAHLQGRLLTGVPSSTFHCGVLSRQDQAVIAVVCVAAGLVTGLAILVLVHCRRKVCLQLQQCASPCQQCPTQCQQSPCTQCHNPCQQYPVQHVSQVMNSDCIQHAENLYYPSSTKSTYCSDDDYFFSLSHDKKTFQPIPVSEL